MASIRERVGRKGRTYEIQVKAKDVGSGNLVVKTATWKPPAELTKKQAEKELNAYAQAFEEEVQSIVNGNARDIESLNITFKDYAIKWLERSKPNVSLSYYVNSKRVLEQASEYIGGYKLKDINPRIIQNFYDKLDNLKKTTYKVIAKENLKEVMKKTGIGYMQLRYDKGCDSCGISHALNRQPISMPSAENIAKLLGVKVNTIFDITKNVEPYAYETIHKVKRTVRAVLSAAKKQRLVSDNYATSDYITFGARPQHEINCLEEDDAVKLYNGIINYPDIRYKSAMIIALMAGLRRGELCGLEWQDIDLDNRKIRIERSLTTVAGNGVVLKEPKTKSSTRTIDVSQDVIDILKEYKAWQENYAMQMGDQWKGINRLFTLQNGDRINPSAMRNWLDKVLESVGLPHVTMHSLRHTNITLQIIAGVPIIAVAARAGHSRTSTTTDVYAKFTKKANEQAAVTLSNMFTKAK